MVLMFQEKIVEKDSIAVGFSLRNIYVLYQGL